MWQGEKKRGCFFLLLKVSFVEYYVCLSVTDHLFAKKLRMVLKPLNIIKFPPFIKHPVVFFEAFVLDRWMAIHGKYQYSMICLYP